MSLVILCTLLVLAFGLGCWFASLPHVELSAATVGSLMVTFLLLLIVWAIKGIAMVAQQEGG